MKSLLLLFIILTGCGYTAYYNTFYNAKEYYTKAMKTTPPNKDFLDKSIQKSEKLIKYYPTCKWVPEALFLMGKCFLEKGDYDNAIIKFEELIEYYPKHPLIDETCLWLGKTYIKKGNYPKAEAMLKKAKEKKQARLIEESAKLIIESYFSSGNYDNTIKSGEKFIADFSKSPLKEDIFLILANACDSLKNFDNAIKYYESALKLTKDKRVKLSMALSKTLLSIKRPDDALKQLAQFKNLAVDTERIAIEIISAQCYKEKQDFEKAIEILKNIQNSPVALYEIGVIYEENLAPDLIGGLEKAKEYYESAARSGSSELMNKATARAGRIEKLLKYQKIERDSLEQDSTQSQISPQMRVNATVDSAKGGDPDTAGESAPTSIKEEGENQFLLAELYLLEFNAPDKALEEYANVIQNFPKSKYASQSAYAIAWIFEKEKKDTVKAISAYENVINNFTKEITLVELSQRAIAKLRGDTITFAETFIEPPKAQNGKKTSPLQTTEAQRTKTITSGFVVQLGAYDNQEEANQLYTLLKDKHTELVYIDKIHPYWKVRIGHYSTRKEANFIQKKLQQEGYKDSWVVQIK